MAIREYDFPWRPSYESLAAGAWLGSFPLYLMVAPEAAGQIAKLAVAAGSVGAATWRMGQAVELWRIKLGLYSYKADFLDPAELGAYCKANPDKVWLGQGFDWNPIHTQRIYEIKKIDPKAFMPPQFFASAIAGIQLRKLSPEEIGAAWIQGVEPNRGDLLAPFANFEGHTVIFGTTGCGKTRTFELLITQAIHRGDVTVIIDPKGDYDLEKRAEIEAKRAGRQFVRVHLAHAQTSARFDCLKNFNRPTEIASRISALIPSETGQDAFTAFAWNVINSITLGMLEINQKPSFIKLRQYIEMGIDSLLEEVLRSFFKRHREDWELMANRYIKNLQKDPNRQPTMNERINGYLDYYQTELIKVGIQSEVISGLLSVYKHDAAHFGKMIANLIPIMSMLTSGELGSLLSPDYDDTSDSRPIWDFEKLIAAECVVYLGLDGLSDPIVSSAVGSLILADAASVAGSRYNFLSEEEKKKKISLFVDECSDVINDSLITILNKGRGAGFVCWVATQTFPDFAAKLGSENKARKALGNFNNLIAMRTKDRTTQDFITETFGEVGIQQVSSSMSVSEAEDPTRFGNGSLARQMSERMEEMIPPDVLGRLPNFQFIGSISGGRVIQGKVPLLYK